MSEKRLMQQRNIVCWNNKKNKISLLHQKEEEVEEENSDLEEKVEEGGEGWLRSRPTLPGATTVVLLSGYMEVTEQGRKIGRGGSPESDAVPPSPVV